MKPTFQIQHVVVRDGRGPMHLFEHTPKPFLNAMDNIFVELLTGAEKRSDLQLNYSAFLSTGEFIGTLRVRSTPWGNCIAAPRKNPWFARSGDWMLRAYLAASRLIGSNFYQGHCRRHYNYGMMRFFQRLGLGGKSVFNDRTVMTELCTPVSYADLMCYIEESRANYSNVRRQAAEVMSRLDPYELLPKVEEFWSPVWSGNVELQGERNASS